MPGDIASLADSMLDNPVKVTVTPVASTVELIDQKVFFVDQAKKRELLAGMLSDKTIGRALVFTRTKHGANKLVRQLVESRIGADAIHGDKTQGARQRALADFRSGRTRVLVATDIAARGIDIDGITHVINFEIPNMPESYVHRIGRTARAGATGIALSFCGPEERSYLRDIERLTRRTLTVVADHPFVSAAASAPAKGTGAPGKVSARAVTGTARASAASAAAARAVAARADARAAAGRAVVAPMAVDRASAPPDQETDVLREFGAVHRDGADLSEDPPALAEHPLPPHIASIMQRTDERANSCWMM